MAHRPDGERVFGLCEDLHARFKGLTANAALFMQKVNRLLAAPARTEAERGLRGPGTTPGPPVGTR